MRAAIVTGAAGFIGGALVKTLLRAGWTVYGVDLPGANWEKFKGESTLIPVAASFEDYEKLPVMIGDVHPEVFYHLAWSGGFTTALRDYKLQMYNAGCAGDALMAAKRLDAGKFVYAHTYNQYEILRFLETEAFEPRYTCIYSTAKTAANLICKTLAHNLGMPYCAGLIPMPYGEENYSKQLVNIVLHSLMKGEAPKLIEGKNLYDLVYIQDIADALIAIGEKGKDKKDYYIGHRQLKTFRELMTEIRDLTAPSVELKFGEYKENQQIDYSKVDLDALYRDTGWECHYAMSDQIIRTAQWVEKNLEW